MCRSRSWALTQRGPSDYRLRLRFRAPSLARSTIMASQIPRRFDSLSGGGRLARSMKSAEVRLAVAAASNNPVVARREETRSNELLGILSAWQRRYTRMLARSYEAFSSTARSRQRRPHPSLRARPRRPRRARHRCSLSRGDPDPEPEPPSAAGRAPRVPSEFDIDGWGAA